MLPKNIYHQYLRDMGIQFWTPRYSKIIPSAESEIINWSNVANNIKKCHACELNIYKNKIIIGSGDLNADWFIIGGIPNQDESKFGKTFAGQLETIFNNITKILNANNVSIYTTNIIKCHIPDDKKKQVLTEINDYACLNFLQQQISLVKPKLIIAMGKDAAHLLLKVKTPISKLRGNIIQNDNNIPILATYSPEYLIHKPTEKQCFWQDIKIGLDFYNKSMISKKIC
jgi:DNA polymerase